MAPISQFVFLGTTPFSGFAQREHGLAIAIANRGIRVLYIEGMPSVAARVRHAMRAVSSSLAMERGIRRAGLPSNLNVLTPPTVPTFSRSSLTPVFDRWLFRRWFRPIEQTIEWKKAVLFVSLPHWWTSFVDEGAARESFIIYDKCDSLLVPSRNAKTLATMEAAETRLMEDANLITHSARAMSPELKGRTKKGEVLFLPNACSRNFLEGFQQLHPATRIRPRIAFVGALDERWVDVELIKESMKSLSNAKFVFVGTVSSRIQRVLKDSGDALFTGAMDHARIPEVLLSCDAAMIPFLQNDITRVVNPLKLYEYSSAGLPVVATATEELNGYPDVVRLAKTTGEFIESLRAAISEKDPKARATRIEFAKANTWEHRVDSLLAAIDRVRH